MAVRIAANAADFLRRAREQGTPVMVLSGEEEARLGMECVTRDPMFARYDRTSIVDVGGQSTEIATFDRLAAREQFRSSFPVGTLKLIGGALKDECPDSAAILSASKAVDDAIGLCFLPGQAGTVAALGATGTNLVSIREQLSAWQPDRVHGQVLTSEEISRSASGLSTMPLEKRSRLLGMEPGRAPTLPAGALILERCLHAMGAEKCIVSAKGWRHALLETNVKAEGY